MKAATGEEVSAEDLGGGDVHTRLSGVADHLAANDMHALQLARGAVARLNRKKPAPLATVPVREPRYDPAELNGIIPADTRSQPTCARSSRASSTAPSSTNSRRASAPRW